MSSGEGSMKRLCAIDGFGLRERAFVLNTDAQLHGTPHLFGRNANGCRDRPAFANDPPPDFCLRIADLLELSCSRYLKWKHMLGAVDFAQVDAAMIDFGFDSL